MNVVSTALLALAMSTDAFAAAVGKGAALRHPRFSEAIRTGLIFGTIEALTPLVGWLGGTVARGYAAAWGPWIACAILVGLGGHLIWEAWRGDDEDADEGDKAGRDRHSFAALALTGLATSIDAMAAGAGLAFADVAIVPVALAIGATTALAVTIGVMVGRWLGAFAGRYAEVAGGLVLAGIGIGIALQARAG